MDKVTGMRLNFSPPLNMDNVIGKYMKVKNEDRKSKYVHRTPLSCQHICSLPLPFGYQEGAW